METNQQSIKNRFGLMLIKGMLFLGLGFGGGEVLGQVTIFSENMGTVSATTAITSYTGWENNGILTFYGTGDIRNTSPSSGYTGASGGANVFITTSGVAPAGIKNFQISGINTLAYTNLKLSFGAYKSTVGSTMSELELSYSINGTNWTQLLLPVQPTGTGTSNWREITNIIGIPTTNNLFLLWANTASSGPHFRIDDVKLTGDLIVFNIWEGTFSNNWNDAGNWSLNAVPESFHNVSIPSAPTNQPEIPSSITANCYNLTIEPGASLQISSTSKLTVNGNIENNGSFTIKSDATGTGTLVNKGTFTGTGTSNVEQFITGTSTVAPGIPDGRWWYFGSPVEGALSGTFNAAGSNQLRTFVEANTPQFQEIFNNNTPLNCMQGYYARTVTDTNIIFTGGPGKHIYSGTQSFPVTSDNTTSKGFNFVSNPYVAFLDWNQVYNANQHLLSTVWIRTQNPSNKQMVFDTHNAAGNQSTNPSGNLMSEYIPPMQTFWVRVHPNFYNTVQNLSVNESMISHQNGSIKSNNRIKQLVRLNFSNQHSNDQALIYFDKNASDTYDNFDSEKRFEAGGSAQIYTSIGSDTLVINGLSSISSNPSINLGVKIPTDGDYKIDAVEISLPNNLVLLEDKILDSIHDFSLDPVYSFTAEKGNLSERFILHFSDKVNTTPEDGNHSPEPDMQLSISKMEPRHLDLYYSKGNLYILMEGYEWPEGKVELFDMMGRVILSKHISGTKNLIDVRQLSGIYIVKLQSPDMVFSKRILCYE